jgi:hypothetical protein
MNWLSEVAIDMNWRIVAITALFVVMEGIISWQEGTLKKSSWKKPHLSFLGHGGVWGDFFLFSLINGLVWNYLDFSPVKLILAGIVGIGATTSMHELWYTTQPYNGFKSSFWSSGRHWGSNPRFNWEVRVHHCFTDLSQTGWGHAIFMTLQVAILLLYIVSPVPAKIVWTVSILLTIFWPLGIIQPCWAITYKWIDRQALLSSIGVVGATWIVTLLKLTIFRVP